MIDKKDGLEKRVVSKIKEFKKEIDEILGDDEEHKVLLTLSVSKIKDGCLIGSSGIVVRNIKSDGDFIRSLCLSVIELSSEKKLNECDRFSSLEDTLSKKLSFSIFKEKEAKKESKESMSEFLKSLTDGVSFIDLYKKIGSRKIIIERLQESFEERFKENDFIKKFIEEQTDIINKMYENKEIKE
jgi:hypothetical protein